MQTTVQPVQTTPDVPANRTLDATPSATYVYEAARAVQKELRDQMSAAVQQRHSMLREIEDHNEVGGPAVSGMQQRIVQLDARITELDKAIAAADAQVAKTAAVPGAVTIQPDQFDPSNNPPREVFVIVPMVMLAVFLPLSIAMARRLWRRSSAAVVEYPRELMQRLTRLEEMGESTAVEVERIGEGQRFVTKLLTERADAVSLPSGRG